MQRTSSIPLDQESGLGHRIPSALYSGTVSWPATGSRDQGRFNEEQWPVANALSVADVAASHRFHYRADRGIALPEILGGRRWRGCARDAGGRQGVWSSGVNASIAEAPMKAQRRLGLALSWPRITSAFLIDVAVLVLASHLPGARETVAWWVGIAVAAVVTIATVLPTVGSRSPQLWPGGCGTGRPPRCRTRPPTCRRH